MNLLALSRGSPPRLVVPIALGAVLPDAPMFLFYVVQKLADVPGRVIWSHAYYLPGWQALFDAFNSLPLIGVGLLVAYRVGSAAGLALFASMALHALCDLPLHHDDAHRHFFPFSDWRFASPVSYWDPRHYGRISAPLELAAALVGCALLLRRHRAGGGRGALGPIALALAAVYALFISYAIVVWLPAGS